MSAGRQTVPVTMIDAFGARWTLDVSGLDAHLADELLHLWDRAIVTDAAGGAEAGHPAEASTEDAPDFVARRTDDGSVTVGERTQHADDLDVPYLVSRLLTTASIVRRVGSCVMLHAAGIATDDGGTVALVAASGTGKTTASRVLGRSLGYVSDETIAVEHDLTVRPYPKPLSIIVDPGAPTSKHERSPDDLGLVRAPRSLHLSAVAVLDRRDDVAEASLEPIGLVEALALVLPQTSGLVSLDRPLDRLARVLSVGGGPYRLTYRDIDDCVDLVADLAHARQRGADDVAWTWIDGLADARQPAAGDVAWTWIDGLEDAAFPMSVPEDFGPSTTLWRNGFRDALLSNGVLLVMQDWSPVTLPGLAATLWLAAAEKCTVADLVDVATVELGGHPDAEAIVLDTVRALISTRILTAV